MTRGSIREYTKAVHGRVLVHMISDISEKANHIKFLKQAISYTSLRAHRAQYYIQVGAAQSFYRLF